MKGEREETLALRHLQGQRLQLVARNYRCKGGELDLVMRDADTLVVIEVRKRSNANFGSAAESVDARKQAKIVHATRMFLSEHAAFSNCAVRFDVVALDAADRIEWLQAAFDG